MSTSDLPSYKNVVVGGSISPTDINQMDLGDCYFLSACASVAERSYRFQDMFLTSSINTGGIFAMTIHARGIPVTYYVDD
jgi:hypothetical protein